MSRFAVYHQNENILDMSSVAVVNVEYFRPRQFQRWVQVCRTSAVVDVSGGIGEQRCLGVVG